MTAVRTAVAALAVALALAACGRTEPQTRAPEGPGGSLENAAPPAPPAPGKGYLKLRTVYDYVGDREGTPWASFELNGDYNYPEPIYGGWPIRITPVDASGNPTGPTEEITTLQELSPTDGRYVERPAGRYRLEKVLPSLTQGGGVWSVTGANSSQGDATTAAGATTSQIVTVAAGETTVARFFNVCRVNGVVQNFPGEARVDVNAYAWECLPYFGTPPASTGTPGTLDGRFGAFGSVTTDFNGRDDLGYDMVVQPDGKMVVAGRSLDDRPFPDRTSERLEVARYNPNGTLDPRFGTSGKVSLPRLGTGTDYRVFEDGGLALQEDGKIVIAGGSPDCVLTRLNPDGSVDTSFGGSGRVVTDFSASYPSIPSGDFSEVAIAVEVQPDGKIVAAGSVTIRVVQTNSFFFDRDFALARYNPDGSLDSSFGTGGRVTTNFASSDFDVVQALAIRGGKIVAGGRAFISGRGADFALARYNMDGSLDATFGQGGRVSTDFGPSFEFIEAVIVLDDGRVIAAGTSSGESIPQRYFNFAAARYLADGRLDPSFSGDGKVTTDLGPFNDYVADAVVQGDGKLVLAGTVYGDNYDLGLVRYNVDGSLDANFGQGGVVRSDFAPPGSADFYLGGVLCNALALQPDGKIVAAGQIFRSVATGTYDFFLARYFP